MNKKKYESQMTNYGTRAEYWEDKQCEKQLTSIGAWAKTTPQSLTSYNTQSIELEHIHRFNSFR